MVLSWNEIKGRAVSFLEVERTTNERLTLNHLDTFCGVFGVTEKNRNL
jgi:hypothetical protein